jgi:hypothetical protein
MVRLMVQLEPALALFLLSGGELLLVEAAAFSIALERVWGGATVEQLGEVLRGGNALRG